MYMLLDWFSLHVNISNQVHLSLFTDPIYTLFEEVILSEMQ